MRAAVLFILMAFSFSMPVHAQAPGVTTASVSKTSSTAEFEAELAKLGEEEDRISGPTAADGAQLASKLFQVILWTLVTCLLAYLILGKLLPKILQLTPAGRRGLTGTTPQGLISIVDRLPLDARRSLCVIKVSEEHFLVGLTDQSMTMLSKLDLDALDFENAASEGQGVPGFSRFAALLKNHSEKETST